MTTAEAHAEWVKYPIFMLPPEFVRAPIKFQLVDAPICRFICRFSSRTEKHHSEQIEPIGLITAEKITNRKQEKRNDQTKPTTFTGRLESFFTELD